DNTGQPSTKYEVEIPSFPIAVMLVAAIDDSYLKKRYALLEAKRVSETLKEEPIDTVMKIAAFFKWKIKPQKDAFTLHFTDYLRNAAVFHEKEWKLVNRKLTNGEVTLTKNEATRLLEEEVKKHIEKRLQTQDVALPDALAVRVERLKQMLALKKGKLKTEEMPKQIVIAAFPPCIKALYTAIQSGHHLSHIGRFTLTTFLVNIGMTPEETIALYQSLSDYNERLTRYQVEHIAGARGSGTKYIPPRCDTLRTHGVCIEPDELCKSRYPVRHPLGYYRRKLRRVQTQTETAVAPATPA
ncbi:MAG TPA: DNA primase large subunit PriL, partial [Candidatus Krumholzibacteriaceae bacterium]|nr:DNA primase large subunit PriL [Candidatus Krumholzibacteriaceae bacterium]